MSVRKKTMPISAKIAGFCGAILFGMVVLSFLAIVSCGEKNALHEFRYKSTILDQQSGARDILYTECYNAGEGFPDIRCDDGHRFVGNQYSLKVERQLKEIDGSYQGENDSMEGSKNGNP